MRHGETSQLETNAKKKKQNKGFNLSGFLQLCMNSVEKVQRDWQVETNHPIGGFKRAR